MSKVVVVTDSSAYLPPVLEEKYNITVTPQVHIWGNETFFDGVDILPDEFYKRLATSKVMPTTSQVAIVTMKTAFEKLLTKGYCVLGIFISAKLSGTMQSATQAREMLPKGGSVYCSCIVTVERPVSFQQSKQDLVGEGERPGKHLTPSSPGGDPGLLIDGDH